VTGELDCLKNFQFDFNLGTDIKMPLFDLSTCLTSMYRQGFMYMNSEFHAKRTNYPMELRHLDISLATMLFSQNRYGFGITPAKSSFLQESIPVLVANETEHITQEITAHATYNGYFSLLVPMSARFSIGILLGRRYSWVQIDSIQMLKQEDLYKEGADLIVGQDVVLDAMNYQENGLFELNEKSMLYLFFRCATTSW